VLELQRREGLTCLTERSRGKHSICWDVPLLKGTGGIRKNWKGRQAEVLFNAGKVEEKGGVEKSYYEEIVRGEGLRQNSAGGRDWKSNNSAGTIELRGDKVRLNDL